MKIVDLSYPWGSKDLILSHYAEGEPVMVPKWGRNNPWGSLDRRDSKVEITNWIYSDGTLCPDVTIWSHAGTHIETPGFHMCNPPKHLEKKGVADYPPERYIGEAAVIDLTPFSKKYGIELPKPDYSVCVPPFYNPAKEKGKGTSSKNSSMIFSIPLTDLRPLPKEDYREFDPKVEKGDILLVFNNIGGLSLDVNWIIDKGIKMVAMQNVWFHGEKDGITRPHDVLLANEILIIEGIRNLEKINKERVFFIGMPWHLLGVGASPIWAIAIEEFENMNKQ